MSATTYPKGTKADKAASLAFLSELLAPGDTLHTEVPHVARSGMSRHIRVLLVRDSDVRDLTSFVADVLDYSISRKTDGMVVGGCGMDMGFHVVYSLSRQLFSEGYPCIGERTLPTGKVERCPANDHCNGDRDYTPGHVIHRDGGYAINQRWL